MAMTTENYRLQLASLLPRGTIWEQAFSDESVMGQLMTAMADSLSRADDKAEQLIEEADPRQTTLLFRQWLSVCGVPSDCIRAFVESLTDEKLRQILVKKIQGVGLSSRAFLIGLAAEMGAEASIEEKRAFKCRSRVDQRLYSKEWRTHWFFVVLHDDSGKPVNFSCRSRVNERLATWGNSALECLIKEFCPAHTKVRFIYSE